VKNDNSAGLLALRLAMQVAGVSQAEISRQIETSRQWVNDVLLGQVTPSPNFIRQVPLILATRLGEDPAKLRALCFPDFVEAV